MCAGTLTGNNCAGLTVVLFTLEKTRVILGLGPIRTEVNGLFILRSANEGLNEKSKAAETARDVFLCEKDRGHHQTSGH